MFYQRISYPIGKPKEGLDVLWRCQVRHYSVIIDAEAERYGSKLELELIWFEVLGRTAKGCYINEGLGRRFMRLDAVKRHAWETEELAIESLIARKKKQKAILNGQLLTVQHVIEWAEHELKRRAPQEAS